MNKLIQYFTGKYLAAWVVMVSDTALVFIAYVLSAILRFNFELGHILFNELVIHGLLATAVYVGIFSISRTSTTVLRHSGLNDLIRVFRSSAIACLVLLGIASLLLYGFEYRGIWLIPKSIIIIQFLIAAFLLSLSRLIAKATYSAFLRNNSDLKNNVLIFGAGESGRITCQTILAERYGVKEITAVIGFIDDNKYLQGKSLEGLPIYSIENGLSSKFLSKNNVSQLVLSIEHMDAKRKRQITNLALQSNLTVKEIPPYDRWIHGELSIKQIQTIRIESLLGRNEIALNSDNIQRELKYRTILITGGAGSIGSELARQAMYFQPKKVIIVDQAETALNDLFLSLQIEFPKQISSYELIVGDINNEARVRFIFEKHRPEMVFHAAAYKHVPMMEMNPLEAIRTNVFGTKSVTDMSVEYGVKKFVLVSTDKAVNPTNIMGASKRIAEMYTQTLSRDIVKTKFVITRFGNVLGSSGSVIPLFKKQIDQGGPVTITHKDITRYFMTISEACNLVLEAGSLGNKGEIFVFDMGEPVKIYDLAKKMIQLSGGGSGGIQIETIGLRPGEKLYEEMLANQENTIPTHHEKILKANIGPVDDKEINKLMTALSRCLSKNQILEMVQIMKKMVPEYKSNNSEFARLDKEEILVTSNPEEL